MDTPTRVEVRHGRKVETLTVTWSLMNHENLNPDGRRRFAEALRIVEQCGRRSRSSGQPPVADLQSPPANPGLSVAK